jgi:hypothetical protein
MLDNGGIESVAALSRLVGHVLRLTVSIMQNSQNSWIKKRFSKDDKWLQEKD